MEMIKKLKTPKNVGPQITMVLWEWIKCMKQVGWIVVDGNNPYCIIG